MGVNSLPKTVTRQRRDYDLNPGPSAPEYSMLTTRLPSHPVEVYCLKCLKAGMKTLLSANDLSWLSPFPILRLLLPLNPRVRCSVIKRVIYSGNYDKVGRSVK